MLHILSTDQCKRKKLWSTDSSKKRSGAEEKFPSRKTRRTVATSLQTEDQLRFLKLEDRRWHVGAFIDNGLMDKRRP